MKLSFDQNLSRRILPSILDAYPLSTHVVYEKLETATDEQIWKFAKANDLVIITKDSDFEELSIIKGTPPKVIWIKVGNTDNKVIANISINNKFEIEKLLSSHEVNCIELFE